MNGLFLEGGAWDQTRGVLADPPYGQLYTPMNVISFLPVKKKKPAEGNVYECPVYKTAARQGMLTTTGLSSNFVVAVDLPCVEDPQKWILRGTALLSEITN